MTTTNRIDVPDLVLQEAHLYVRSNGTHQGTRVYVVNDEGKSFALKNVLRVRFDVSLRKQVVIIEVLDASLELSALLASKGIRIRQRSTIRPPRRER